MKCRELMLRALLVFTICRPLAAQVVSGQVAGSGNVALPGVLIQLLDSSTTTVARTLSNERGEFRISAPGAGRYRIRTLRIGLRPTVSPEFSIGAGEVLSRLIVLNGATFALDTVKVSQRAVCRLATDSAATTYAVWEQARAALMATILTSDGRSFVSTAVVYQRLLDASTHRVMQQSSTSRTDSSARMWTYVPLDSLREVGYVVLSAGDSTVYRAPSLEVLASDYFAADHCFRMTTSPDPARLGLSFEPTRLRQRTPEIAGTLWLDRATSQLLSMEFHYVNVDRVEGASRAGGAMDFMRLSDGAWVIARWSLTMPILTRYVAVFGNSRSLQTQPRTVVSELQEVGGELASVRRGDDTLWVHSPLEFRGIVVDSATGLPVVGALLALTGTPSQNISDAAGRFIIRGAIPGQYTLAVHTASLDSLHAVQHVALTLVSGAPPAHIRVASAQNVAAGLCRDADMRSPGRPRGILIGTLDAAGDTLVQANVTVEARWVEESKHESKGLVTRTDSRGNFRLCGVPISLPISVEARSDHGEAAPLDVSIAPGGRFALVSLTLDKAFHGTAVFTGMVVDSVGQPIAAVEIALPKLGRSVLTGDGGAFRLAEVASGPQDVRIRKIGFGPLDTTLSFGAHTTVTRRIVLSRVTVLKAAETVADANRMREFEENRHLGLGHFFTQDDVERLRPVVLAQLLSSTNGLRIIRSKGSAFVVSSRGPTTLHGRQCGGSRLADVYLDGMRVYSGKPGDDPFDINLIDPKIIAGIEYYAGAAQTPAKYMNLNSVCGVIVIWTRR